jgi:hypothetical protein
VLFIIFKNGYGTNKLTIHGYLAITVIFSMAIILSTCTVYLDNEYLIIKNGFGLINRKKVKIKDISRVEFFTNKMRFSPKRANLRDWRDFKVATFEKRGLIVRFNNGFALLLSFGDIEKLRNEIEKRQPVNSK